MTIDCARLFIVGRCPGLPRHSQHPVFLCVPASFLSICCSSYFCLTSPRFPFLTFCSFPFFPSFFSSPSFPFFDLLIFPFCFQSRQYTLTHFSSLLSPAHQLQHCFINQKPVFYFLVSPLLLEFTLSHHRRYYHHITNNRRNGFQLGPHPACAAAHLLSDRSWSLCLWYVHHKVI